MIVCNNLSFSRFTKKPLAAAFFLAVFPKPLTGV